MKRVLLCAVSMLVACGIAYADETAAAASSPKPLNADYVIYSGELGDQRVPTKSDRKLSIVVHGQPAKAIFDSLYPDMKVECNTEQGERQRRKGEIWCIHAPKNGYMCFLGFDLRTGKSIAGGIC